MYRVRHTCGTCQKTSLNEGRRTRHRLVAHAEATLLGNMDPKHDGMNDPCVYHHSREEGKNHYCQAKMMTLADETDNRLVCSCCETFAVRAL